MGETTKLAATLHGIIMRQNMKLVRTTANETCATETVALILIHLRS